MVAYNQIEGTHDLHIAGIVVLFSFPQEKTLLSFLIIEPEAWLIYFPSWSTAANPSDSNSPTSNKSKKPTGDSIHFVPTALPRPLATMG